MLKRIRSNESLGNVNVVFCLTCVYIQALQMKDGN